jgi:hypothetical protein
MNTLELDIVSPMVYANPALLHERYERYRKDAPIAWIEQEPYRPFWALTRHADIVEIEKRLDWRGCLYNHTFNAINSNPNLQFRKAQFLGGVYLRFYVHNA